MARRRNLDHVPVDPLPGVAPWIGGKHYLANRLAERIAAIPHRCYAEPFIGMGGVFLRRARRAPVEVINDRAGDVVNLFRVLQRHPAALVGELRYGIAARETYDRLLRVDPATLTDIERAARFYYLQQCAFSGTIGGTFRVSATQPSKLHSGRLLFALRKLHHRLIGVQIENQDFEAFIRRFDRPTTLFYLDPPYWGCETYYGKGLFSRADFARLAAVLRSIEGRFILSLNDTPGVRETFGGFKMDQVPVTYRAGGSKKVAELVIRDR